jgi:hypothetical protein
LREENILEGVYQHAAEDSIQTKKEGKLENIEQLGASEF